VLTGSQRQARLRERTRDAVARLDAARHVLTRADKAVRFCGDVEIIAAWLELCEILQSNADDQGAKQST
jgi:hypothetical protein